MTNVFQNNTDFQRYKRIKELLDIEYRGYNLKSLIAYDVARVCFSHKWPKLKSATRFFVKPQYKKYIKSVSFKGYLFSKIYTGRKDHDELLKSICNEINSPYDFIDLKNSFQLTFNLKNVLSSYSELRKIQKHLRLTEFIYYWASLCYYKNYLKTLDKYLAHHIKIKAFIAHNSSLTPYSIWVLFFKKYNIPTYSNQHGLNVNFSNRIPLAVLNFENITADNMLCWGKQTIEEIKTNYDNNNCNLILAGNPKFKELQLKRMKLSFTNCIVLLGSEIYEKGNIRLLSLVSKYSKEYQTPFYVKTHPSLSEKKYKKIIESLNLHVVEKNILMHDLLKTGNFDFAITYNSSAYYETMPYGIPCLRFSVDMSDNLYGLNDKFSSHEELRGLINTLKVKDNQVFNKEVTNLLNYVLGINDVNYSKLFQ